MSRLSIEQSQAFVESLSLKPIHSGVLSGLKFAVKDNIDVKGCIPGNGNPTWRKTHPPSATHAICVEQLLQAGAECIGRTICSEFCFAIDGENYFYGTPLNPKAPERIPGGSSSGSASATACGIVDFAIGTDAGGSIRVPASNCGVYGMRPSHDTISITGVCPFASTYDTIGFFAQTPDVLCRVGSVLLATDLPTECPIGTIYCLKEAVGLCDPEVQQAIAIPIEQMKKTYGSKFREISFGELLGDSAAGHLDLWLKTFTAVQWSEIWTALGSWIEFTKPELGPRTKVSFDLAKNLDRSKILEAIRMREYLSELMRTNLKRNDLICIPTTPALAPLKNSLGLDRSKGNYFPRIFSLTSISGIARLPQVTMPLAHVENVPVGLSLLASRGADAFLLQVVKTLF